MKKTELKCLTITADIIATPYDWTTKALLGYIQFRVNHPEVKWTFSQADVCVALNEDRQKIHNRFKTLIAFGVLILDETKIVLNGKVKLYAVNAEKFNEYLVTKPSIPTPPCNKTIQVLDPLVTKSPYLVTKPSIPCNKTMHYKNDTRIMIEKNDKENNDINYNNDYSGKNSGAVDLSDDSIASAIESPMTEEELKFEMDKQVWLDQKSKKSLMPTASKEDQLKKEIGWALRNGF